MNFQEFQDIITQRQQAGQATASVGAQQLPAIPDPPRRRGQGAPCVCPCCTPGNHCKNGTTCLRVRNRRTQEQLDTVDRYENGRVVPERNCLPITPEEKRRRMDRRNERTRERRRAAGAKPVGPRVKPAPKLPPSPAAAEAAPDTKSWYVYAHRNNTTITLPAVDGDEASRIALRLKNFGWDGLNKPDPIVGFW